MNDLIYRQDAIDAMRKLPKWNVMRENYKNVGFSYDDVMFALEKLPSAHLEIIRCKDCVNKDICRYKLGLGDNGFCSQGSGESNE